MRISDLATAGRATVTGFDEQIGPETVARLRALGFVVGTVVTVERRLPFGGPMVVRLGDGSFALESEAAHCVRVAPVDAA